MAIDSNDAYHKGYQDAMNEVYSRLTNEATRHEAYEFTLEWVKDALGV